jgi:YfiR/HmsC-like
MSRLRRFVGSWAIAVVLCAFASAVRVDGQQGLEYEVKAAYLYNIIDFVTWPANAFAGTSDPIRVCVVGTDPFGPVLDRTLNGTSADKRPIVVQRISNEGGTANCSLIFLPRANAVRAEAIVRSVAPRPVLTVGETPDFLEKGGMIAFVVDGGRVRFDVNLRAATARGLGLSSRLLRVARNVVGAGEQP